MLQVQSSRPSDPVAESVSAGQPVHCVSEVRVHADDLYCPGVQELQEAQTVSEVPVQSCFLYVDPEVHELHVAQEVGGTL